MNQNHKNKSTPRFLTHLIRNMILGLTFILCALFIGMMGYHTFEQMSWIDAFANASMILSGMGPLSPLLTTAGKLFAGFYALFSGLAFIIFMGVIFSPIIHVFFRKIHLESNKKSSDN